jgi:ELL-associated factor
MADKFGIGSGPHELKIGNSFANRGKNGAGHPGNFHTIRYDFKPASLDPSKSGVLAVTENSLNVKVPHSNGSTETNYSGHCTDSSQKECVLIIDQTTGEITLEKLSSHMRLKKTRQERPEKSVQIDKMINSGLTAPPPSNISTNSNSSRPQTPVSAFKRDSPVATPKPLSRSASPHIPNQQTTSLASAAKVSLSESSSDSSSSGSDSDSDLEDGPPFQKAPVEPSMPSFLDSAVPSPPPLRPAEKKQSDDDSD